MRLLLGLSVLLTLGCLVPADATPLPGCRPTKPAGLIIVEDIIIPVLRVDEACGDPDAEVEPRDDMDADRLSDAWERAWFGTLTTASGAPGALTTFYPEAELQLTDLEKWRFGLNPTVDNFVVGTVHAVLTYDPRGQLTAVTFQGKTVSFGYDAAGNLRTITPPAP